MSQIQPDETSPLTPQPPAPRKPVRGVLLIATGLSIVGMMVSKIAEKVLPVFARNAAAALGALTFYLLVMWFGLFICRRGYRYYKGLNLTVREHR